MNSLETRALNWLLKEGPRYGPSSVSDKYGLWERDLLYLAQRSFWWRCVAILSGFSMTKIDEPWPHKDAGRRVELAEVWQVRVQRRSEGQMDFFTSRVV